MENSNIKKIIEFMRTDIENAKRSTGKIKGFRRDLNKVDTSVKDLEQHLYLLEKEVNHES